MTKGQFKVLNEKLDTLLSTSKSSSNSEYSLESHKALIETLTKEHAKTHANSKNVFEISEKTVWETTEKSQKNKFLILRSSWRTSGPLWIETLKLQTKLS